MVVELLLNVIVVFCSFSLVIYELLNQQHFRIIRRNHPIVFIFSNALVLFAAMNAVLLIIFEYTDELWESGHILLILISWMLSLLFGISFLQDTTGQRIPTDPIQRELWWLDGFLRLSDNPAETFEQKMRELIQLEKLSPRNLLAILDQFAERRDAIGSTAAKIRQELLNTS